MASLAFLIQSCSEPVKTDLTQTAFIPKPVSVTATGTAFEVNNSTIIYVQNGAEELMKTAEILAAKIGKATEKITIQPVQEAPSKGIYIAVEASDELGAEGYELTIDKKLITIKGTDPAGCFYGVQTFLQTLPANLASGEAIYVPTGTIRDYPVYAYRGMMLDVSRHFFPKEDVKKVIDMLAAYKINIFHLHLSDDQGWRIEIKSWPKLTEIGGSTQVGGGEGGYYTQEDYKEIVQYAMDRSITIVPEIDMPGHTNAALASYAELNCDGKARDHYTGTEVGFSSLCTDKEITYEFIDDVVRELAEITPGPYFHIGGDESLSTKHDDYVYFVNRVQKIVEQYGKKVIGWDEIANAELIDNATIQFWANEKNTKLGVEKGAQVIMSPARYAYLDMQYDSTTHLGLHWAAYIEVDRGYNWDPAKLVEGITQENIKGIEAPLWAETITNLDEIEYMVFPRISGYAEIGWTPAEQRDWESYKLRLAKHGKRFEKMEIDYYKSKLVPWEE
ncbi:beta-N-acetylhexosaminidase [Maribellus sp. YY47]|uniref:beta-N-acetylhexosaminidase n=1 Tax=Maribellus sp. YY47 TaxID=2929486 RepID=UPI0020010B13|nr:beta-N-acetylhexosaminidase [Maribellus sp. YY47]MCK3686024.1 beta-N-acetylhexosaminidase [Maribellus sp. YY47]